MIGNKEIKIDGNYIIVDGSRYYQIIRAVGTSYIQTKILMDMSDIVGIQICCIKLMLTMKALIGIPDIKS